KQCLNNPYGMGNTGGYQCTRQRTEHLPVDDQTLFCINATEPIHILPMGKGSLKRYIFGIRDIIGDPSPLKVCKTRSKGNLSQQTGIRSAMSRLNRVI